ncbi:MAG: DUF1080 domain-containing protein [Planctomycetes bacterium]|nr:DUF1080 domain-containing protein [Planctomycetota bacterium]
MLMRRCVPILLLAAFVAVPDSSNSQEKKKPNVFTNAAEAGPDFLIQGEYEGKLGSDKAGAQVVALGDGKFDVYLHTGGLPGAGWDLKGKVKADAKTDDGKVVLTGKYTGGIADGKLAGKTPDGIEFSFAKLERKSPTMGAQPPEGALVLFDGKNIDNWNGGKIVEENLLFCGTSSKKGIGLGKLHLEFRSPFQPKARGQGRGNSGVYMGNSEIQILDSFGLTGANNECGAFYNSRKPDVNMCMPPLSWQTYDVDIAADGDNVVATVLHNGVKVHDKFVLRKGPAKPVNINLQNHGDPVMFRNIWFAEAK